MYVYNNSGFLLQRESEAFLSYPVRSSEHLQKNIMQNIISAI